MPKYEIEATAPTVEVSGWTARPAGNYFANITVEADSEEEAKLKADELFKSSDESNEFIEIDTDNVLEHFDDEDEDFEPTWDIDFQKAEYKVVEVKNG